MLLQEVAAAGAHIPAYGQMKLLRERVASNLNKLAAFHFITDWKNSSDRAKRIMRQLKAGDAGRARASGEEEGVDDTSSLLTELVEEADGHAVAASERKGAEAVRQQRLEEDGAAIRAAVMGRMRGAEEDSEEEAEDEEGRVEEEEEEQDGGGQRDQRRKRRRKNAAGLKDLDDEITFSKIEEMQSEKREMELKRLDLEERKFERECQERDKRMEERKEQLRLKKQEKLAFINLLTSMSESS